MIRWGRSLMPPVRRTLLALAMASFAARGAEPCPPSLSPHYLVQSAPSSGPASAPHPVQILTAQGAPDGKSVFYVTRVMGGDSAMRISIAGDAPPVRVVPELESRISISPQSNAIAFLRYDQVAKLQTLVTVQPDGTSERILAQAKNEKHVAAASPGWSPSGDRIAYAQIDVKDRGDNVRLMTVQPAGGQPRELGESRWQTIQEIYWMPDGRGLAVIGYGPMPTDRYITIKPEVWFVDYPSGHARQLTDDPARFRGLSSPANGDSIYTVKAEAQYTVSISPIYPALHPGTLAHHLTPPLPLDCQRGTLAWLSAQQLACAYPSVVVGAGWKAVKFPAVDASSPPSPSENLHCPQKSPVFVGKAAISNQVSGSRMSMSADAVNKDTLAVLPAFLPDGTRTAYSMYSPLLRQVKTFDGDYVPSNSVENHYSDAALSSDGRWVVTMDPSGEQRLLIWDAHRNAIATACNLNPDQIGYLIHGSNLSWTLDSKAVLVLLNGSNGTNLWKIPVDPSNPSGKFPPEQLTAVQEVSFTASPFLPAEQKWLWLIPLLFFPYFASAAFTRMP
jgi:hypothetical protein